MITKRVQYRYDSVRNKIGMTDADGGLHTYTYDVMRRLTGVINPLGERTTYAYDLNGRRTSVQLANGTRTSYEYDLGSRVQMVHTLKSDDSTVSKFEYEYDGNGRRTSVLEADGSRVTWTYDRISQVTSEWRTGTAPYRHTFTYDKVGNRTLKIEDGQRTTLVYDACNQLLTSADGSGTTTFTYDGNGNQTVVQKPNGDRTTQVWDYENRPIKTIQPSGGVISMAYDADGLRLKLEEPTGTKLFVWDDQNYLAETDAAGTTETAFTTEPSTYGSLISHRKAGASTTYHFDALGSTRALTDESETVLERYNYTAFGTLLGSPTLLTPFLWGGMVGYYWDAALATQYIRARHYQPAIARWISLDPIGFAGGDANLFRYVGNSPTSGTTGMRVRLSAAAYGKWQLAIARSVLNYLTLAHTGWSHSHRPLGHSDGMNRKTRQFALPNIDSHGLDPITISDGNDGLPVTMLASSVPMYFEPSLVEYRRMMKRIIVKLRAVSPCIRKATGLDGFTDKIENTVFRFVSSVGVSDPATTDGSSLYFPDGTLKDPHQGEDGLINYEQTTILHETIHALDYSNRWNLGLWFVDDIDAAEGLAYGAIEIIEKIDRYNHAMTSVDRESYCNGLKDSTTPVFDVMTPRMFGAPAPRRGTPSDLNNISARLGLYLDCEKISACLECKCCPCCE